MSAPAAELAHNGTPLDPAGSLQDVASVTSSLVSLSRQDGTPDPTYPRTDGFVLALASDGSGGWFVGGFFERIGGFRCANLARVTALGKVDRKWCPRSSERNYVTAIVRSGTRLYVAGTFSRIGG